MNPEMNEVITIKGPKGILKGWKTFENKVSVLQGAVHIGKINQHEKQLDCWETTFFFQPRNRSVFSTKISAIPVDIGNPHAIVLGPAPYDLDPAWCAFNRDFPDGVNVSFGWPKIDDGLNSTHCMHSAANDSTELNFSFLGWEYPYKEDVIRQSSWQGNSFWVKTWERGIGFSRGCGSAACAIGAVLSHVQEQLKYCVYEKNINQDLQFQQQTPESLLRQYELWMPGGCIEVWPAFIYLWALMIGSILRIMNILQSVFGL